MRPSIVYPLMSKLAHIYSEISTNSVPVQSLCSVILLSSRRSTMAQAIDMLAFVTDNNYDMVMSK